MKRPGKSWAKLVSDYQQDAFFNPGATPPPPAPVPKLKFAESDVAARIKAIPWFTRCGEPFSGDLTMPVEQVKSWAAATKACKSSAWEEALLEGRNVLYANVERTPNPPAVADVNKIVKDHKRGVIRPLVERSLKRIMATHGVPETFLSRIEWTLLMALMENSFARRDHGSFFFRELLTVYEGGHLPCGWRGTWPKGALIVY